VEEIEWKGPSGVNTVRLAKTRVKEYLVNGTVV